MSTTPLDCLNIDVIVISPHDYLCGNLFSKADGDFHLTHENLYYQVDLSNDMDGLSSGILNGHGTSEWFDSFLQ